jgi:hypothetical protein
MRRIFAVIRGGIRIMFGFCPKCNSDAPGIDNCMVCNGYRWGGFGDKPDSARLKVWWYKFINAHEDTNKKR